MARLALLAGTALLLGGGAALAQEDLTRLRAPSDEYRPALTSWGEPDLRGGWPIDHLNGRTPLQRAAEHGNRQLLTEEEFAQRTGMVEQLEQRFLLGRVQREAAVVGPGEEAVERGRAIQAFGEHDAT